ncbi:hypothetical protein I5U23_14380 [Stenotrophomonas maltophilia]|uniref:DUF4279 domain-containing protein n=1 Tax=Stenotrophomonas riyadhensis TaxID=2859893 RepID=A0ABT2XJ37_9GAMM|nr:hypothetical protein [Stenotrophomonas sp. CFS3442]MBH1619101.1 hypothetical protein [Stenotrophomonas maltophilia]MCV0325939.1 hypothetical protein [Stenotrophomonas sp. CFS3442]HEL3809073.1 hypothetical protein [Stenotrophomonas maltophilia]HEL4243258.1 hypothetical protein [Stenotrophomonas maltophilia]
MYCYDYRISLGVQHPTEAGAGIAARLDLEPAFSRDVGTGYRDRDGTLIRVHTATRVVFVLERGNDGWLMDAWPALIDRLRERADVIKELLQEGAGIGLRVGIFGKTAWAGFVLDQQLLRLMADLQLDFQVETYFPDPVDAHGTSVEVADS